MDKYPEIDTRVHVPGDVFGKPGGIDGKIIAPPNKRGYVKVLHDFPPDSTGTYHPDDLEDV